MLGGRTTLSGRLLIHFERKGGNRLGQYPYATKHGGNTEGSQGGYRDTRGRLGETGESANEPSGWVGEVRRPRIPSNLRSGGAFDFETEYFQREGW